MTNRKTIRMLALLVMITVVVCGAGCNDKGVGAELWPPAMELQTGRDRPMFVAADETHVYWVEIRVSEDGAPHALYRMPRAGGEPEHVHTQSLGGIGALALDDEGCYLTSSGTLLRYDTATLELTPFGDVGEGSGLLARDGRLYWWDYDFDADLARIHSLRSDGTDPQVIGARAGRPTGGLGIDASRVYWGSQATGEVLAATRAADATEAEVIAEGQCPHGVAVDETHVYWHQDDSGCYLTEGTAVYRAPITGAVADPSLVELVTESAGSLVQGSDGVYYTAWAKLYRATVPEQPEVADYVDIGCQSQGGWGRCFSPIAMLVDALGAVLVGWEGQDPGTGWVFTIPRL
ncbi:MAG: hypothetical protein ABI333_30210 [bacterium]